MRRQPSPWLVLKGVANPGRPSVEIDVLPRQPKQRKPDIAASSQRASIPLPATAGGRSVAAR